MKKWGILITLVLVSATMIAAWFVFIRMPEAKREREIRIRQSNLRSVASYVRAFPDETEDGLFPEPDAYDEALKDLTSVWPEPIFGPSETQDDIWIVPFPWPDRRIPDDIPREELAGIPLLHERVDLNPDGTSVAFWDGHVEFLTNEEFEAIIDVEQSVCLACEFAIPDMTRKRGP